MVGDPKRLSDLASIEAALSARCRSCGRTSVYDRVLLQSYLSCRGGNTSWPVLAQAIPCRCGSTNLALKPVPYAGEIVDPELRPYERALIDLAVAVLTAAEHGRPVGAASLLPVRLALRVLMPHCDRGTLSGLWQSWGTENPLVRDEGVAAGMAGLRDQLRMRGRWKAPG